MATLLYRERMNAARAAASAQRKAQAEAYRHYRHCAASSGAKPVQPSLSQAALDQQAAATSSATAAERAGQRPCARLRASHRYRIQRRRCPGCPGGKGAHLQYSLGDSEEHP
jgi:hypothetical protein